MDAYSIIITPDAEADLVEISNYIANDLMAPETALRYVHDVCNETASDDTYAK